MRLYLWSLFRLVITVLLLGGAAGILKGFEAKDALTKREKYVFNTSIIMLTLLLGINLTVSHEKQERGNIRTYSKGIVNVHSNSA